ncbi:AAA family ATPase [Corynebacterium deserti]|uniref:AAA family ATPase n=1 Tax=Corynebacterium deserti TaxID=1408191 RepID=UPI001E46A5FC|nr:AAA family ATPase [Corynebacterium deserti]
MKALAGLGVAGLGAAEFGSAEFTHPVTIITGENGVGKSTILEAIAVNAGFDVNGGAYVDPQDSVESLLENPLEDSLRGAVSIRRGPLPMYGYFLRAETHFNVATDVWTQPSGWINHHQMSHGESVMHTIQDVFTDQGLYLLDEPEAGLSFIRQMAILAELYTLGREGSQIIMVTHSPILLAIPGADIWEFTDEGEFRRGLDVEETTAFRALRDFLDDPETIAEFMVDVTDM